MLRIRRCRQGCRKISCRSAESANYLPSNGNLETCARVRRFPLLILRPQMPLLFQINGSDKNAGMAPCGEDPLKLARTGSMPEKSESALRVL